LSLKIIWLYSVQQKYFRSKINSPFCFDISAQLDGVTEKAIKRLAEHHNINDWLELEEASSTGRDSNGKRKVRWADLEERKAQMKMRDIGFVVGQTNWNRMLDPSGGSSALTKTKIIPNRHQSEFKNSK